MNSTRSFNEATIRMHAAGESFSRGVQYYQRGAVLEVVQRGDTYIAQVEGSQYEPYLVTVEIEDGALVADCTCPYDYGDWCKHIVAVLLTVLHKPTSVIVRPPLAEALAGLNRDQLQALVLGIAERSAAFADAVDTQLALMTAAQPVTDDPGNPVKPVLRRTPIDVQPIKRQVRSILRPSGYDRGYGYAGGAVIQLEALLKQARAFTGGGDGSNALLMLEAFTDEFTEGWVEIDDSDGELGDFFRTLGKAWAEALLTADLTATERQKWIRKLQAWRREANDYGVGDGFLIAEQAAKEGWEPKWLKAALTGVPASALPQSDQDDDEEYDDDEYDDDYDEEYDDFEEYAGGDEEDLNLIRLAILERQGRFDEYLNLARATGYMLQYVTMLAHLGRIDEALELGLNKLEQAEQARQLAVALRQHGAPNEALRVAEHGLTLAEPRTALASWLIDLAEEQGQPALALHAAEQAFLSQPTLQVYRKVQSLAGDDWPPHRDRLLEALRQRRNGWYFSGEVVDIFLHEHLIDDAIEVAPGGGSAGIERVMDAAISSRPDWVISTATKKAEQIMNEGKSEHYERAVGWLRRARDAYKASGRQSDWRSYIANVREHHGRKRKLIGLISTL